MKIGIIGGGQLGMMMAEAAHALGHSVIGLDPTEHCSLSHVSKDIIVAPYRDTKGFVRLAETADVLTYEFENVDPFLVEHYNHLIPQTARALSISKDRFTEKSYAHELGIPVPRFSLVQSKDDMFFPAIIKTRQGGYDGKGQYHLRDKSDIDHIMKIEPNQIIIEEYVPFDYEISVIMTRSKDGVVVAYPIPVNTHRNGILHISEVTGSVPKKISDQALEYTTRLIQDLRYVGTLAVEYFVLGDTVLFNEFAPRPHNSGHYTIEGCNVSQFENHIRAITGMELVVPTLLHPTVMINELGQDKRYVEHLNDRHCTYHSYRKTPRKPMRKMGHITCVAENIDELRRIKDDILGEPDE